MYAIRSYYEPITGATILIKGSTKGTVSDIDGNFALQAEPTDVLVISFIGYKPQEVPVGARSTLQIELEEETVGLNEVVAIGYGTQRNNFV